MKKPLNPGPGVEIVVMVPPKQHGLVLRRVKPTRPKSPGNFQLL